MQLQGVLIIIVLFWGALIGLLLWLDNRREQLLRLRVKKLYASKLYAAMWPRIKSCKNRTIEKLTVDRNGFSITFMQPAGEMARYASITSVAFDMKKEGYAPLTETQQQALLVLIEESLPKLTIKKKYALVQKRARLSNGDWTVKRSYVIRNDYKNMLARAPYYDDTLQKESMVRNGWI